MSSLYSDRQNFGNFVLTTFSVGQNATAANGAQFTSQEIKVFLAKYATITPTYKCASALTGDVDFHFVAIGDESQPWPNIASFIITVPANNGLTNPIGPATEKSMQGVYRLKLLKVVNKDAAKGITDVQCNVSGKF